MSTAEVSHKRCPKCEEIKRGFTYRTLINGLCPKHAAEDMDGRFLRLQTHAVDRWGNPTHSTVLYGFLKAYPLAEAAYVIKFSRYPEDDSRVCSGPILFCDIEAIEPMTEAEYMHMIVEKGGRCIVQHFGRKYTGRIIQTARTRVLVRFQGASKTYERWKPVYAVQPNAL